MSDGEATHNSRHVVRRSDRPTTQTRDRGSKWTVLKDRGPYASGARKGSRVCGARNPNAAQKCAGRDVQQNTRASHILNRVHQPPCQPSVRCCGPSHMVPVPTLISFRPSSSCPSSTSASRRDVGVTGKRGRALCAMNGGKRASKVRNSGLGRSGAVHVRRYPSDSEKSRFGGA